MNVEFFQFFLDVKSFNFQLFDFLIIPCRVSQLLVNSVGKSVTFFLKCPYMRNSHRYLP